ncbi:MAG: histidinol dehydrogenase, partial [Coriobacteriaceae bacterium]|nr:histidinol dehydrogenase [Coriobacteriaceae bacterium]
MRVVKMLDGQKPDAQLLSRESAFESDAIKAAMDIVAAVRERGDDALREYTRQFDKVNLEDFRVPDEQIRAAARQVDDE